MPNLVGSDNIKVFPCGNRDPKYNRDSKYTTEHNLISMVNRLVDRDSFVITSQLTSTSGEDIVFNLHGYLFSVDVQSIIDSLGDDFSLDDGRQYIYAAIAVGNNNNVVANDRVSELLPLDTFVPVVGDKTSDDYSLLDFGNYRSWTDSDGDGVVDEGEIDDETVTSNPKFYGVQFIRWSKISDLDANGAMLDSMWNNIGLDSDEEDGTIFKEIVASRSNSYDKYVLPILKIVSYSGGEATFEIPEESKIRFMTDRAGINRSVVIDDGVLCSNSD